MTTPRTAAPATSAPEAWAVPACAEWEPNGRRKNARNFQTDLLDELREEIPVRENGRERRISKQRAVMKALVAAAITGDMRAITVLASFCSRLLGGQTE